VVSYVQIRHISDGNLAAKLQKNSIFAAQYAILTDSVRFNLFESIK